jgi:glycine betaine catabolism B
MRYIKLAVDTFMAKISMYLAVELSLLTIFGFALTLSLTGNLSFHPLELIVSYVVFSGVALGTNYLFAYLFSVKAQYISALITGGILFFLFSPSTSMNNLILYAVIAVIAIASKYVLVWRGRHIFNPAAIAAVIVSLAGLSAASWWVSDMIFAVPVTVFGLMLLYKTQRLQFGLVFLAVYTAVVMLVVAVNGQLIWETLGQTLFAWWPLYFVGFMLSEPLTLAPRRIQYLIEATLVAILIGLHPDFGSFYVTPEIALVVGNIFAFVVSRRRGVLLELVERRTFPGKQETFTFKPKKPFAFIPGQYMEVMLAHSRADLRGERRMFSIVSAPQQETISLTTRYAEKSSSFKSALQRLHKGDVMPVVAVRGDFTLPTNKKRKLLFVAGGIGITPFYSHLAYLNALKEKRDIVLLYAVRNENEVLFKDLLHDKQTPVKTIIIAPNAHSSKNFIVADGVSEDIIEKAVRDITERDVYISGSPAMVSAVKHMAKRLGAKRIVTDDFTGY